MLYFVFVSLIFLEKITHEWYQYSVVMINSVYFIRNVRYISDRDVIQDPAHGITPHSCGDKRTGIRLVFIKLIVHPALLIPLPQLRDQFVCFLR